MHVLTRLRACLDGVEIAVRDEGTPVGPEAGNAIMQTSFELGTILAKLDAYQRAELDQRAMIPIPTEEELRAGRKALAHPMGVGIINPRGVRNAIEAAIAYLLHEEGKHCLHCGNFVNSVDCQRSHP